MRRSDRTHVRTSTSQVVLLARNEANLKAAAANINSATKTETCSWARLETRDDTCLDVCVGMCVAVCLLDPPRETARPNTRTQFAVSTRV